MLAYHTVESHTLELLMRLMEEDSLASTRLVGGTALALQYGHRMSIDLDFFGQIEEDIEGLRDVLRKTGRLKILKETKNIRIYMINDIKIDFVNYHCYPWIDVAIEENGIRLASPKDIAAMKINAIEGRGTKKDFIDIYCLLQHYSLQDILDFYQQKYPENSLFRALMSLSYFEDADPQLMPKMFLSTGWEEMKTVIKREVESYSNK